MAFSEIQEAQRALLSEAHDPPLYTAHEAAKVLERSVQSVMNMAKNLDWKVYRLPAPFHKANCYAVSDVMAAKAILDENGGKWPRSGAHTTRATGKERQRIEDARNAERLRRNLDDFLRRSPSFAEFSPEEQLAFVADMVNPDRPATHPRSSRFDLGQFESSVRRHTSGAMQARVEQHVKNCYRTTVNFSYLNPDVAARVISELLATAPSANQR